MKAQNEAQNEGTKSSKVLDTGKNEEYDVQNSFGGKAMLNRIDHFHHAVVMMPSAVPSYDWLNNGLTLLYPFSGN